MRKTLISLIAAFILFAALLPGPCPGADRFSGDRERMRRRDALMNQITETAGAQVQAPGPWQGLTLGAAPGDWGVAGALVNEVVPDSPGDRAGFMPGDIITAINGQAVPSAGDVPQAAAAACAGRTCRVSVRRGTLGFDLNLVPDAGPQAGRLADSNVLKYAVIDPRTRTVVLLGRYDPAYKTGPIPYYDLLADALRSPYPWFSLEPTQETRNSVQRINAAIEADVKRMHSDPSYATQWANQLMAMLLNDSALSADRDRFVSKGAQAFGITDDEMLKVLAKSANAASVSEDEFMPIVGKILKGLGYVTLGEALIYQDEGPQATFQRLGIGEQAAPIVNAYQSGSMSEDKATLQLTVLMVSAILRGLGVPGDQVDALASKVFSGRMSLAAFNQFMEERLMTIIVDGAGLRMFNGLTLSHRVLGKLYNVPAPQMTLVFRDVPADSLLGDALFRADYALKSICTSPDTAGHIPGFLTEMGYLYNTSRDMGTRVPADAGAEVGHMLVPGRVDMRVSPDGTLVSFDDAQVGITGWVIASAGRNSTPEVQNVIKQSTQGYGDYLTQHYEDLARVFPALHRLREAEKVIALARWAKANNFSLVVDRAAGVRLSQAPTATGFWQGVFTADAQEFSLMVIAQGGAAFDAPQGEAWVRPANDVTVTDNVLEQLAFSNALAGQAADAALAGDLEGARALAEKSALAMTGEIDLTQLPALDVPMPGDPALMAALSEEVRSVTGQNLAALDDSRITMEKAADLQPTSPQDAAQLAQMAAQQKQQAEQNLRDLNDALEKARANPARIGEATVVIRNLNARPATIIAPPPDMTAPLVAATPEPAAPAVAAAPPKPGASKSREELLAELDKLEKDMDATKKQLALLNQNIMKNQQQFQEWQSVAEDGMNKCRDVLFGLFMDASAGKLADRYETMYDLAKKLPDQPMPLIKRIGRTSELLTELKDAKSFKDVLDWAYSNGDTLPETIDKLRDGIGLLINLSGLDKTPAGAAWVYGSNIVDLTFSFVQYTTSYDALMQQTQNVAEFNKALASLKARMDDLYGQTRSVKQQLADMPADEDFSN